MFVESDGAGLIGLTACGVQYSGIAAGGVIGKAISVHRCLDKYPVHPWVRRSQHGLLRYGGSKGGVACEQMLAAQYFREAHPSFGASKRGSMLGWLAPLDTGELQVLLLRYTMALITQMSQTAVCYRHHSAEQQLCRWLLMSLDRLPGNDLVMTQELIADMLGVRRQSVTEAASKLQADGVIRLREGA
jgi:hypothetical protein